jgi:hypothetical protein
MYLTYELETNTFSCNILYAIVSERYSNWGIGEKWHAIHATDKPIGVSKQGKLFIPSEQVVTC